jgi:hypothetical protein
LAQVQKHFAEKSRIEALVRLKLDFRNAAGQNPPVPQDEVSTNTWEGLVKVKVKNCTLSSAAKLPLNVKGAASAAGALHRASSSAKGAERERNSLMD